MTYDRHTIEQDRMLMNTVIKNLAAWEDNILNIHARMDAADQRFVDLMEERSVADKQWTEERLRALELQVNALNKMCENFAIRVTNLQKNECGQLFEKDQAYLDNGINNALDSVKDLSNIYSNLIDPISRHRLRCCIYELEHLAEECVLNESL